MKRNRRWRKCLLALLPLAVGGGCLQARYYPAPAPMLAVPSPVVTAAEKNVPAPEQKPAGPLNEEQLIALAVARHPDLAMAQAKVEAAQGKLLQAGAYPNPRVGWQTSDWVLEGGPGAAGKQGPQLVQEIVTNGKRQLAQASATQALTVADRQGLTQYHDAIKRVRQAYFELLAAQLEAQVNTDAVKLAREAIRINEQRLQAGAGTRADILRVTLEMQQAQLRLQQSGRRIAAARNLLATALGQPGCPVEVAGSLTKPPPQYQEEAVLTVVLANSSEVLEADAAVRQAAVDVQLAEAQICGNVEISVNPYYNFGERHYQLDIGFLVGVPLFHRNQGNILAARAEWLRAVHQADAVRLKLRERVTQAYQKYANTRQQVEQSDKEVLPTAREFQHLVQTAYEKGDSRFDASSVYDAQRTLVQVRLTQVQALSDLWQAVAEVEALLQQPQTVP